MTKCDYGNCTSEATVKGQIYGRENKDSEHRFYDVNSCDKHAELDSFFWAAAPKNDEH